MPTQHNDCRPVRPTFERKCCVFERNIFFLTDDSWRIAIQIDLYPYDETISTIRADLLAVEQRRKDFTFTFKPQSIETLLTALESKLHNFKQILPKLDPRRGLLNLRGTML